MAVNANEIKLDLIFYEPGIKLNRLFTQGSKIWFVEDRSALVHCISVMGVAMVTILDHPHQTALEELHMIIKYIESYLINVSSLVNICCTNNENIGLCLVRLFEI